MKIVVMVFGIDENRLFFTQAIIPAVIFGAGLDGAGSNVFITYLDTMATFLSNKFITNEMSMLNRK